MKNENEYYKKIGLKCGLEIHQQLDTGKLFCNCPCIIRDDAPDIEVRRKLKAVIGESGKIDAAASFTAASKKTFIYEGYEDTTCPIEFDEEPPREMNNSALELVLQVSTMLGCSIVDEVQVMRKIVVDGSNTSGFQRTALVGRHGSLKTEYGHVGIPTISIEEDAGKIVKKDDIKNTVRYNLSRLGIPLIEIGTDPDIITPDMAKEVAAKLGMILRSTGKVKRGLGTIRQDLNVSISGGARIEIKGAQDLKMIPKWVDNEIERQKILIEIKNDLLEKKAKVYDKIVDVSSVLENTKSKIIRTALQNDGVAYAIRLGRFKDVLGKEVQMGRRVGSELSDYAKMFAGVKGLFHSDEDPKKYSVSNDEVSKIRDKLGCKEKDAFILIADTSKKSENAFKAVIERANVLMSHIPKEVRKANPDGTTSFMRPMPGCARMYPETDCVPVVTSNLLDSIEIPELIEDKAKRYQEAYNLSNDLADLSAKFDFSILLDGLNSFEDIVKKFKNIEPSFIAQSILYVPKEIKKRQNIDFEDKHYSHVIFLLEKINDSIINKEALLEILPDMIKGKEIDFSKYKSVDENEIRNELKKIIELNKDAPFGALMGKAMAKFRGKVDGKKISQMLKELS